MQKKEKKERKKPFVLLYIFVLFVYMVMSSWTVCVHFPFSPSLVWFIY